MGKSRIWTRDFLLLTLVQTMDLFAYNMITPVIAKYALEQGVILALSGLAASAFAFAALLSRPFSGFLADRLGKKRIVLAAIVVSFFAQAGYAFAPTFEILLALRILHGFFYALFGTAISALALQAIPEDRRGEGMGWFGTAYVAANALGPALGVYLSTELGFDVMFFTAAGVALASFFICLPVKVEDIRANAQAAAKAHIKGISDLISPACVPLAAVAFCYISIWSIIATYIVLVGESRSVLGISAFFVANSIALFITRPIAGKIADRKGLASVVIPSLIFEVLALLMLAFSQSLWLFLVAAVLKALGSGTALPSIQATCGKLETPERGGVAMSTYLLGTDLGYTIGPFIGGALVAGLGYDLLFVGALPLVAACAIIFVLWIKSKAAAKVRVS